MSLGDIFIIPKLLTHRKDTFDHSTNEEAQTALEGKYLAITFAQGTNNNKYNSLWRDLKNNMILSQDSHSQTLSTAYDVLQNYHVPG